MVAAMPTNCESRAIDVSPQNTSSEAKPLVTVMMNVEHRVSKQSYTCPTQKGSSGAVFCEFESVEATFANADGILQGILVTS